MVTIKHYAEETGAGIEAALSEVSLTPSLIKYLKDRRAEWKTFGKMNSHLYRGWLFKEFEDNQLTSESRMLVYALASVIKSQPRIVQAMKDTPENEQFGSDGVWFAVRNFFEVKCTQYVSSSKKQKKFPVVNIPTTFPGLDILMWCLTTEDEERTFEALMKRPTFTQINLNPEAQTRAKEGYEYYWTKIVKGTKNEDKVEKPEMREEYYNTSAADKYKLYTIDSSGKMDEFPSTNSDGSYSVDAVKNYLKTFETSPPPAATG